MSKDRIYQNIAEAGLSVVLLGTVAICVDGMASVIAAGNEASLPISSQTHPLVRGFRERRGPTELGVILSGIITTHLGIGFMAFRGTPETSDRRSIVEA